MSFTNKITLRNFIHIKFSFLGNCQILIKMVHWHWTSSVLHFIWSLLGRMGMICQRSYLKV